MYRPAHIARLSRQTSHETHPMIAIRNILLLALAAMMAALPGQIMAQTPRVVPTNVNIDPSADPDNVLRLDLSTGERVLVRLMPEWAPNHVERIKTLTRQGFYDGVIFHRVIDGFMAQTGDPTGTGQGGSQLPDLEAEFNAAPHLRGTLSMARTDNPNSANSQFFIVFYPRFSLDRKYTVFGRVIDNMTAVDRIAKGEPPANPTRIVRASLATMPDVAPAAGLAAATAGEPAISVSDLDNSASD